ncbi:MAG: aldo/keto reductase [Clostridia bacterium]|nr:aldo/keto reductase [Clostridia bacterium]
MIYNNVSGENLSLLGFGTMRLPLLENGEIDEKQVDKMVALALERGVNYFDTAYPYHGGLSESTIGKALSKYPRESYYLADKFPGHQLLGKFNPKEIFEEQLERCGVEYFDYYLFHNVNENSIKVYKDENLKILDYLVEEKKNGRIKHLGFSSHGLVDNLNEFLDYVGDNIEFCQIQLNYLDWDMQNAKEKYKILKDKNIPVWVMEPVRGGKLATLPEEFETKLKEKRPNSSVASWGFRWLQSLPNVKMILSGMSNMEQMEDNLKTFDKLDPTTKDEEMMLFEIANILKDAVPCTSCRYCCDGCPVGLDIPKLISLYNDFKFHQSIIIPIMIEALDENKRPNKCIKCGKCARTCPQKIDVPKVLSDFAERLSKIPSWTEICKQREEERKKNKNR